MPGPLQSLVQQLGLDDPTQPPAWSPDMLQQLSQQYPNFAQALDQNNIHLNITGPNIIGGPEPPQLSPEQMQQQLPAAEQQLPAPPQGPSLFDRAGEMLSKGDLSQRFGQAYWEHGPQALGQGLSDLNQVVQENAPQGAVPLATMSPALKEILGGAGTTLLPAAYPSALMHPLSALVGGVAGIALAGGTEKGLNTLGVDPEVSSLMGNMAGFLPPEHLAMAALPFAPFARKMLTQVLDEAAGKRVAAMLKENPALEPVVQWLHPSESVALSKMTPAAQAEFLRVHESLPPEEFLGAVGRAGEEKLGWYQNSRAAVQHVYGELADMFAGVLAATSPQNSVEMNLQNATRIFRGWIHAGKPTDRETILKIMGENVLGDKGEKSVLNSWKNNTVEVLQGGQTISGPKVDSFWRNLRNRAMQTPYGEMRPEDAMTLDAWMSNVLGVRQSYFAGQGASGKTPAAIAARMKQFASANPGYGPGYLAATAGLRKAATGGGMTPEQLQETMWSWAKALYEQSEKTKVSAVDIIKNGTLDHSAIAGTPDFSTLFHHPDYAPAIAGTSEEHAARLATLQPASFPQARPSSQADYDWQLKAAAVLDRLRENRDIASDLRVGMNQPGTVGVTALQEGLPGLSTRVAPELSTNQYTQGQRDRAARTLLKPNTNVRGENVLMKALMLPTTETTVGIGRWTPAGKKKPQFNTLDAAGARLRLAEPTSREDAAAFLEQKLAQYGGLARADALNWANTPNETYLQRVVNSFKPHLDDFHAALRARYGDEVPVYRAQHAGDTSSGVRSFSLSADAARDFLGQDYRQGTSDMLYQGVVPVTDVLGIGSSHSGEVLVDTANVRRGSQLNQEDAEKVILAAHLQGLLDAQDAVATTGVVYDQAHKDTLHVFTENKVKQVTFEKLSKLFPDTKKYALVNKGGGDEGHVIDVIRIDGQPLDAGDEKTIQRLLNRELRKPGEGPPKVDITPATNAAGTYAVLPWSSGAGSGEVTKFALRNYAGLSAAEKASLDSPEIKQMAATKLKFWDEASTRKKDPLTVPADYRNMLRLVAEGGVSKLAAALADPAQILPALLLLGLVRSASQSSQTLANPSPSSYQ